MADDDPTTPDGSKKPQILSYLNPRTLQQANRKTGQWLAWFVRFCIYILMPVMLISILMPCGGHSRARGDRVKCASNLRQIGQALALYHRDNKCWPRTRYDPTMPLANGFTGGGTANPFAANGPSVNDPTAAMFLLVKTTDWCETPWVGVQKDNIYTSAQLDAAGNQLNPAASVPLWPAPQGALDTVLVPRKGNGF